MIKLLPIVILVSLLSSVISQTISLSQFTQPNSGRTNVQNLYNQFLTYEPRIHTEWRNAITSGLTSLPIRGIPGRAVVFGMNAAVIAVGDVINDVLIAAGQVGNGRVLAITHNGYISNFSAGTNSDPSIQVFHANIKNWLARGSSWNASNIMDAGAYIRSKNATSRSQVSILFFSEPIGNWSNEEITIVLNFVKNGGGLFVSSNPWAWAAQKKTKDFNLMLTYRTLLEAGISFTTNKIRNSNSFQLNKTTHLSHLAIQIDIAIAPQIPGFDYTTTFNVLQQAEFMSPQIIPLFQSRINFFLPQSEIQSIAPSQSNPITSTYLKARILCYQFFFLNGKLNIPAPNHQSFPGAVDETASNFAYVSREFTFTNPGFREYHHTGLYAVPGQAVTIEVIGALPTSIWTVSIGFHYGKNNGHRSWIRWPTIFTSQDLARKNIFSCAFGGLIVLENHSGRNETVVVKVSSAVEAPWYDSQNATSIADWSRRKRAVGAWGCAQGKWIGLCMPRASFQNVDPLQILNKYDQIQLEFYNLRGSRPQNERKRYIIADRAPQNGQMQAGYPIVTPMSLVTPNSSRFLFNYTILITDGQWGIFHELGHNMQRRWWTPPGTVEVTVNIFSLKAIQMVLGKSPRYAPWLINKKRTAARYLLNPNFAIWKSRIDIAICLYAQVIENYGWDSMRKVLTSYETGVPSTYPTTEQGIIDLFWSKYSLEVGQDLSDLLRQWDIPFTSNFTSKVVGLPPYAERVNFFDP